MAGITSSMIEIFVRSGYFDHHGSGWRYLEKRLVTGPTIRLGMVDDLRGVMFLAGQEYEPEKILESNWLVIPTGSLQKHWLAVFSQIWQLEWAQDETVGNPDAAAWAIDSSGNRWTLTQYGQFFLLEKMGSDDGFCIVAR